MGTVDAPSNLIILSAPVAGLNIVALCFKNDNGFATFAIANQLSKGKTVVCTEYWLLTMNGNVLLAIRHLFERVSSSHLFSAMMPFTILLTSNNYICTWCHCPLIMSVKEYKSSTE